MPVATDVPLPSVFTAEDSAAKTEEVDPGSNPFHRSPVALRVEGAAVRCAPPFLALLALDLDGVELAYTDCPARTVVPTVPPAAR